MRPPESPASPAQHGMWLTEQTGAGWGPVHHMPLAVLLEGPLDVAALQAACEAVVARHPVLASALAERDGELRLVPAGHAPPFRVEDVGSIKDLEDLGDEAADAVLRSVAEPFELSAGPFIRFTLLRSDAMRHLLLAVAHHAAFDGMSKDILLRDIAAAYGGAALPPLTLSYGEAVAREHARVAEKLAAAAEFWRPRWRDGRELLLPGLRRVSVLAAPGEAVAVRVPDLGPAAGELGVTRFELLLAAMHTLLRAYGNADPIVSADVSTRTEETADHVGMFVNELPVRVAGAPETTGTFGGFARAVRAELRAAYHHREVPVARALGGVSPRASLTPVSVSYRRRGADPRLAGLRAAVDWTMFNRSVRGTLHLQAVDAPGGITAQFRYDPRCLDRAACETIAADLTVLLRAVAERPGASLADLPVPSPLTPSPSTSSAGPAAETPGDVAGDEAGGAGADVLDTVLGIWRDVLKVDEIEPGDDLFDLGGHSLSITQIIARVRDELGVELSFEVFIDDPTAAGIAAEVARAREEAC